MRTVSIITKDLIFYYLTLGLFRKCKIFYYLIKNFKLQTNSSLSNPVLLVLDNHYSHISLPIYNYCKVNGIVMLSGMGW